MKNIKLYYATEENGFEGELIGKFATNKEVIDCLRENISDDVNPEKSIADNAKEIDNLVNDEVLHNIHTDSEAIIEFENCHGYAVTYVVTTNGRSARSMFADLRRAYM